MAEKPKFKFISDEECRKVISEFIGMEISGDTSIKFILYAVVEKIKETKKDIKDLKEVVFLCFLARGDINNLTSDKQVFIRDHLK